MRALAIIATSFLLACGTPRAFATPPLLRTHFAVTSVLDANGLQTPITALLRGLLIERFKHHANLTLALPADGDQPHGYETSLRVHAIKQRVRMREGRRYLEVEVTVHLIGTLVPENALHTSSLGRASETVRISLNADPDRVAQKLLPEIASAAIEEAVDATVGKMDLIVAR